KLDLARSALLAALISSPSAYDPVYHPDVARSRRNLVLSRMQTLGMLTELQYAQAIHAPLGLDVEKGAVHYAAPYFVDYVKRWFLSNEDFGATPQARYDLLFEGGLRIYTTVDLT